MTYMFGDIFPHLLTLTEKKKLKCEGNDYLQKIYHNWAKAYKRQAPCFKQDQTVNQRCVRALQPLCTLWLPLQNSCYYVLHK